MGRTISGWQLPPLLTDFFGTDYFSRGTLAYLAMFENTPIEAYYPSIYVDTKGDNLDGSSGKYTMTFKKGETPPVGTFWSTTMYDQKKRLMVENPINSYKIGSADNLVPNKDGSITIYFQSDCSEKKLESNWLLTPKASFYMLYRMYQPEIEVLNGQYVLPGLVKQ